MTERFPPDCSSVSGRFRNTTFICFGPSAASLALRAHSRGLRPPVLVLRLLRWRCALATGLSPCLAPSTAPLALRASGHLARLLPYAARSPPGRRPAWLLRLLRFAARLGSPRSTAPLRCALAVGLAPRLAPSAARSAARLGSPRSTAPLRCALAPRLAPSAVPLSFSEQVRARFHKRRACATLAGAAAHGFSCPLHPFLTCL